MKDAVIGYLQVASGLTDVTRQRATATAKSILGDGGLGSASDKVSVGQVQTLAEEIVAASKANRELLTSVIRAEVDRAVAAFGLATRDDVAALRRQVERLQDEAGGQPGRVDEDGGTPTRDQARGQEVRHQAQARHQEGGEYDGSGSERGQQAAGQLDVTEPLSDSDADLPDPSPGRSAEFGQQSLLPPTSTGDPLVDVALAHLDELGGQPVHEHVATFEGIHAALAELLADLDPNA